MFRNCIYYTPKRVAVEKKYYEIRGGKPALTSSSVAISMEVGGI